MFTQKEIQRAHDRLKTGISFSEYIQELNALGVKAYQTYVKDGHSEFYDDKNQTLTSSPLYPDLVVSDACNPNQFREYLELHQQGKTGFAMFCEHCAATGIEKWLVDFQKSTCTYFAKENTLVFEEKFSK